jgi:hypothetical protein
LKTHLFLGVVVAAVALSAGDLFAQRVVAVRPDALRGTEVGTEIPEQESFLQSMMELVDEPMELRLAPGVYNLKPFAYADSTCRSCQARDGGDGASVGMIISGGGIHLVGGSPELVTIVTHSTHGLLFLDCENCGISGVTIVTGDLEGADATTALTVSRSSIEVSDCVVLVDSGKVSSGNTVFTQSPRSIGPSSAVGGCRVERR